MDFLILIPIGLFIVSWMMWWLVFVSVSKNWSWIEQGLVSFWMGVSEIVLLSLITGWLGVYGFLGVGSSLCVVLLVKWMWLRKRGLPQLFGQWKKTGSTIGAQIKTATDIEAKIGVVLLGVIGAVVVWSGWLSVAYTDVSFDGVNYHLPWITMAQQTGQLGYFETQVPWVNFYPKNIEMWYGWLMSVPGGSDWLVDGMQIVSAVGLFVAVYAVLRLLKVSRWVALISGGVVFSFPVVLQQMTAVYNDVTLVFMQVMLLLVVLLPVSWLSLVVFSVLAGVAIGSKATMVIPVALGWIWMMKKIGQKYGPVKVVRASVVVFVGVMVLGSYWYLRNLILVGNPFFPVHVTLGNVVLFPGVVDTQTLLGGQQPSELVGVNLLENLGLNTWLDSTPKYDMTPGGFGVSWRWVLAPLLVLSGVWWLIKERSWGVPMAVVSFFVTVFVLTPGNWWWRYVICLAVAGVVVLALALEKMKSWKPVFSSVAMMGVVGLVLASVVQYSVPYYFEGHMSELRVFERQYDLRFGEVFAEIESIHQESNATFVVDTNWTVVYPLWNSARLNSVLYFPVTETGVDGWWSAVQEVEPEYLALKTNSLEYQFVKCQGELESVADDGHYSVFAFVSQETDQ